MLFLSVPLCVIILNPELKVCGSCGARCVIFVRLHELSF